jgi:hypothetical protein
MKELLKKKEAAEKDNAACELEFQKNINKISEHKTALLNFKRRLIIIIKIKKQLKITMSY